MAVNRFVDRGSVSAAEVHLARVAEQGCARHHHLEVLLSAFGADSARNLADAVHLLCSLHGRHPGLVELVLSCAEAKERDWLAAAADAFEQERLFLVRLTSAVGPLPSTPGAAETEAGLLTARNALEILARSERRGCALGAACALVGDWLPIRTLLDRVAGRAGLEPPVCSLPDDASVMEIIDRMSDTPASKRALGFGAEQLLLQHRALFDLLEARASARIDY